MFKWSQIYNDSFENTTLKVKDWSALPGKEPNEAKNVLKQREHEVFREKGKL